jgi:hypothetical protein
MNLLERFEHPQDFYGQLSPDQQQAAGQQFQQFFGQSSDPQMQQYAQSFDPNNPDPRQLGRRHDYAQQHDPSILQRVMDHPVLDAALVGFGIHEYRKHEEDR